MPQAGERSFFGADRGAWEIRLICRGWGWLRSWGWLQSWSWGMEGILEEEEKRNQGQRQQNKEPERIEFDGHGSGGRKQAVPWLWEGSS